MKVSEVLTDSSDKGTYKYTDAHCYYLCLNKMAGLFIPLFLFICACF